MPQVTESARTDLELVVAGQPLSHREREVLTRAAAGMTVEETASELFLAIDTIKGYRRRVIAKLRANNISHAVAIGFQEGILP
jgi:DNA-binding CsgD family transcriptional regulator